ncbi:MAG: Holliday junction resolvase RuvX [bacterium]|nr:Holliday junction resolvase RuvX [bacterium]
MPDIIALDFGGRRIGVARANSAVRLPEPLPSIDRKVSDDNQIFEILKSLEPEQIILGLPKNTNGDDTEQTKATREFHKLLTEKLGTSVRLVDEALSTVQSDKWRTRYPKANEDSLAACIILERYFGDSI